MKCFKNLTVKNCKTQHVRSTIEPPGLWLDLNSLKSNPIISLERSGLSSSKVSSVENGVEKGDCGGWFIYYNLSVVEELWLHHQ